MSQEDLAQVLSQLPRRDDPRVIVGTNTTDDAGVVKISDDFAIVQTIDVFSPVIDDPFDYGYIVAANSMSDCWAMGGKVMCLMNAIGFPIGKLDSSVLASILSGGAQAAVDAETIVVGGHTWTSPEIYYGMAVTGSIHPDKIVEIGGAKHGDLIIQTKPLGIGTITHGIKPKKTSLKVIAQAVTSMKKFNKVAAELMMKFSPHACTDITGFGFVGHLANIVKESGVSARIDTDALRIFDGAIELSRQGVNSPMGFKNFNFLKHMISVSDSIPEELIGVIFDAETSGGLMVSLEPEAAHEYLAALKETGHECAIVGEITSSEEPGINLE